MGGVVGTVVGGVAVWIAVSVAVALSVWISGAVGVLGMNHELLPLALTPVYTRPGCLRDVDRYT